MTASDDDADEQRRRVGVAERPSHDRSSRQALSPSTVGTGELGQLADHDVDRRTEEEAGDDGARQELRDPAELEHREEHEEHAGHERDRRDELGRSDRR